MSFYRKYRPQKLSEIVGQDHVRRTFLNALKKGGLTHAYLFSGTRGTGKTSTARIIARALNCLKPESDGEPCNKCEICTEALAGRLVDLIEIDAASNRGIDEIRELKEKIVFAPSRAKAKIYVIDEVHMLTKEAFNALLKTLEEPPEHAYFILATTEAHKVPETILSRCQRFDFHRIDAEEIAEYLGEIAEKEGIKTEKEALGLIAHQSAGGMRDALGMLEQLGAGGEISSELVAESLGLTHPKAVDDFVFALLFKKLSEALETINGLVSEGVNLIQFNKAVLGKLREQMLQKVNEGKIVEAKEILIIIEEFTQAGNELKSATIPQLPLEMAAIVVCDQVTEKDTGSRIHPSTSSGSPLRSEDTEPSKKKAENSKKTDQQKTTSTSINDRTSPAKRDDRTIPTGREIELSPEKVKNVLPEIIGKVSKSFVKVPLRDCSVVSAKGSKIVLGFGSDFVLDKLNIPEVKNELADLFSDALGKNIKVELERVEIKLASSAPDTEQVAPQEIPDKKKSLAEEAEELFAE